MKIIKEIRPASGAQRAIAVIRTNTYNKSMAHLRSLEAIALIDFPDLNPVEINVVHYGGRHYKGTMGIEFPVDGLPAPNGYSEISKLEETL